MRYLGKMITKLLVNEGFVDSEDKAEIQENFDKSFDNAEKSQNRIIKGFNQVMNHPIGAVLALIGYVYAKGIIRKQSMLEANVDMEQQFQQQLKAKVYSDILNEK